MPAKVIDTSPQGFQIIPILVSATDLPTQPVTLAPHGTPGAFLRNIYRMKPSMKANPSATPRPPVLQPHNTSTQCHTCCFLHAASAACVARHAWSHAQHLLLSPAIEPPPPARATFASTREPSRPGPKPHPNSAQGNVPTPLLPLNPRSNIIHNYE